MHATLPLLQNTDFPALERRALKTLQVNLGYRCNQTCVHCHVNAGPPRRERVEGGVAPAPHPAFRTPVEAAAQLGVKVMDPCNLTILFEPGQEGLADFLATQRV